MKRIKSAPKHLSPTSRAWWSEVLRTFDLESHELPILVAACEAMDRAAQAREIIDRDGVTVKDRFGQAKPNPACGVERDAQGTYSRLVRQLLALDDGYEAIRPARY